MNSKQEPNPECFFLKEWCIMPYHIYRLFDKPINISEEELKDVEGIVDELESYYDEETYKMIDFRAADYITPLVINIKRLLDK